MYARDYGRGTEETEEKVTDHCVVCKFFMRHREVKRGELWSDENSIEVDSIWGDCRRYPPKPSFFTGHRFPVVTTGHWCGEFERRE